MKKIVFLGLIGTVFIILAGGGSAWLYVNYIRPPKAAALKNSSPEKKKQHDNDIFVPLKESVITLSDAEGADRYMLLALTMVAEDEEAAKKIQADEPLYQSIILTALADMKYEQIRALKVGEIKSLLSTALSRELKKRATPGPYSDMLIGKLVFQ